MPSSVIAYVISNAIISTTMMPIWLTWVIRGAVALIASKLVSGLTHKKPKQTSAPEQTLRDANLTVRQPITHWDRVYGLTRKGGALTYWESDSANRLHHLVVTVCSHAIDSYGDIYFDDTIVPIDASGDAQGKYAGHVRIKKSLGNETYGTQPFPDLVNESAGKWTNSHRQDGHAKLYIRIKWNPDLFPTGLPNITAVIRGKKVYDPRAGLTKWSPNAALCQADYLCDQEVGIGSVYAQEVDEAQLIAAANSCDERVLLKPSNTTFTVPDHTDDRIFLPDSARIPSVGDGIRVSPSSGATLPTPLAINTTYYVIPVENQRYKLATSYANALAGTAIDITSAGSGELQFHYWDENRYECHGVINVNDTPKDILGRLLTSMLGECRFIGGKWKIQPAVYSTPSVTLTESDIRGPITITPRLSRRDLCNGVKGIYSSPNNKYQPSDFPPVTNALYLSEDQNERIWQEADLAFTKSASMAQRIAKVVLERVRQQIVVELPCKLSAYKVMPGSSVMLTLANYGWSSKVFEVLDTSLVFEQDDEASSGVHIGVDLTLRETASGVYDWNQGEETIVDLAPDSNLPNPFSVSPPGAPAISEVLYATTGSAGVKTKAVVTWGAPNDAFVDSGGYYVLEYKDSASSTWQRISPLTTASTEIEDLAPAFYDFRVSATNTLGVSSVPSPTTTKELVGLTAAPASPQNFSVRVIGGQGQAILDKSIDLDVVIGGRLIIKWSPLSSGATWNDGTTVHAGSGDTELVAIPLNAGTYMAKFEDSTGHQSVNEASFVVTDAQMTGFTTLSTVTEHPAFSGSKVNIATVDNGIQLTGATLWDDFPPIDSVPLIDYVGGIVGSGTYTFTNRIDLGSVLTVKLVPHQKGLNFDTGDLWDDRTTLIDSWDSIDGAVIGDCDSTLYTRTTNDNPAASPTWGPWHELPGQADYTNRAFEFKLVITSGNTTHNRRVTELSVAAKQPT